MLFARVSEKVKARIARFWGSEFGFLAVREGVPGESRGGQGSLGWRKNENFRKFAKFPKVSEMVRKHVCMMCPYVVWGSIGFRKALRALWRCAGRPGGMARGVSGGEKHIFWKKFPNFQKCQKW